MIRINLWAFDSPNGYLLGFLLWVDKFMGCVFMGEKKLILIMFGVFRGELTFFRLLYYFFAILCNVLCFYGRTKPSDPGSAPSEGKTLDAWVDPVHLCKHPFPDEHKKEKEKHREKKHKEK